MSSCCSRSRDLRARQRALELSLETVILMVNVQYQPKVCEGPRFWFVCASRQKLLSHILPLPSEANCRRASINKCAVWFSPVCTCISMRPSFKSCAVHKETDLSLEVLAFNGIVELGGIQ